jgi:hypothetical protein
MISATFWYEYKVEMIIIYKVMGKMKNIRVRVGFNPNPNPNPNIFYFTNNFINNLSSQLNFHTKI